MGILQQGLIACLYYNTTNRDLVNALSQKLTTPALDTAGVLAGPVFAVVVMWLSL